MFAFDNQQCCAMPFNFVDEAGEHTRIDVNKSDGFAVESFGGVAFEFCQHLFV
mgnify:CR=1 FL=1